VAGSAAATSAHARRGGKAAKASRKTASQTVTLRGFEARIQHLEGGYTVGFERFTEDLDLTPYHAGLPDDACPVEHWGYVLAGRLTFRYADREEVYAAGDAFFAPAGHTPVIEAVRANMEAAGLYPDEAA
jgi:mannose-6-phosphate isomerase-like protein (cupin superfamily)